MSEGNQPVRKFRVGSVTAAVWQNGENTSVTLQKSYKDKESGDWRNTTTMFLEDVVNAQTALKQAEQFLRG